MKPFFENFSGENVAQDPVQLLAQIWCPYLFWVLKNLPYKFEKMAHVTKSAKKTSPYGHLATLVPQKPGKDSDMDAELTPIENQLGGDYQPVEVIEEEESEALEEEKCKQTKKRLIPKKIASLCGVTTYRLSTTAKIKLTEGRPTIYN